MADPNQANVDKSACKHNLDVLRNASNKLRGQVDNLKHDNPEAQQISESITTSVKNLYGELGYEYDEAKDAQFDSPHSEPGIQAQRDRYGDQNTQGQSVNAAPEGAAPAGQTPADYQGRSPNLSNPNYDPNQPNVNNPNQTPTNQPQ